METPATRFVEHDGVNIAWQVFGDGPAEILFVPGWVSNLDLFSQYPYGTRIAGTAPRANPLGEDRAETRPPAERSSCAAPFAWKAAVTQLAVGRRRGDQPMNLWPALRTRSGSCGWPHADDRYGPRRGGPCCEHRSC